MKTINYIYRSVGLSSLLLYLTLCLFLKVEFCAEAGKRSWKGTTVVNDL